jgi:beta-lactamase regulating signal transducer with metallopeptidase domain
MTSNIVLSASTISMLMLLAKATMILLAALGITQSMQRASAGARHLVWLVTLATLLLVPALTAWAPIPLRILPATSAATPVSAPAAKSEYVRSQSMKLEKSTPATIALTTERAGSPSSIEQEIGRSPVLSGISILLLVWAAVVLAIAAWLGYAAMMVRRIVNRARPLDSEDWLNPLWEVSDRLSLEEPPRLLRSEDAKMPFACGVFNPTIVLPAECDTWSLDRRRAVLLHELAHVRRHDLVGHTLGRLTCAFYWFHPLVWTAAKQLRSESERACDDLALTCGARAADYAEHLLDIVTSVRHDATPSVALAIARPETATFLLTPTFAVS